MTSLWWPTLAGVMLGITHVLGLSWTLRRGVPPARWVVLSFLLRTGFALGGAIAVAGGDRLRLFASLAGLLLGRVASVHLLARWGQAHGPHA
jgi:F1F0 ATPase subunit 2